MMNLTAAFTPNPCTSRVLDKSIAPTKITWTPEGIGPGELFFRQLKYGSFDVSELSMSSLTIGIAQGNQTWAALPIFTTRAFYHTDIIVREDSPIGSPAELRGGRVGVLEYQQTSVVWIRGILESEFGVPPSELEWFMERLPDQSHGGATGFAAPAGVRLSYVPKETSLAAMLEAGTIDAILFHPTLIDSIDQKADGARERLRSRPLFADPGGEAARYHAKTGIVPVNHTVVVRRTILEQQPEIAEDIYETFCRAHDGSVGPYGVVANCGALDTLMQYLAQQQLTKDTVALKDVFWAQSLLW